MELKKEIESLLFSSGKVMTEQELAELTNNSIESVKKALESLKQEYDERDTSLMLVQSDDKWKLNVREKYMNLVTKIVADTELPFPVLETLAVIAYKAPVLQAEVIKIRGTNAYEHVGELVKEEFVEKKKEGRSYRLSLTSKFFKYFDVEGERDIKEAFKEVKVPEKKTPERVGMLKVVDVPPEEEEEKAGEEEKEKEETGEEEKEKEGEAGEEQEEAPEEKKITIDEHQPDHGFIEDMDKKIGELRERNDELDQDELFKRQEELSKEQESSEEGEEEKSRDEEEKEETEEEKEEEDSEDEEKGTEGVQEEIQKIMKDLKEEKEKIEESHKEVSEGLLEEKEEGEAEEEKEETTEEKEEEPASETQTLETEEESEKEEELKAELKKEAQEIAEELKKGKEDIDKIVKETEEKEDEEKDSSLAR
ncbi:SMC-Scp complex subunit ScpB [Candidatus Woesearchaeota archaeon]|nr:SMC-Scp complex subunit ScpB [Candidatus Woesearchaeota archaeon]